MSGRGLGSWEFGGGNGPSLENSPPPLGLRSPYEHAGFGGDGRHMGNSRALKALLSPTAIFADMAAVRSSATQVLGHESFAIGVADSLAARHHAALAELPRLAQELVLADVYDRRAELFPGFTSSLEQSGGFDRWGDSLVEGRLQTACRFRDALTHAVCETIQYPGDRAHTLMTTHKDCWLEYHRFSNALDSAGRGRAGSQFGHLLMGTFECLKGERQVSLLLQRLSIRWPSLREALALLQWETGSSVATTESTPSPAPRSIHPAPKLIEPEPAYWVALEHKVVFADDEGQTETAANVPYRITFADGHTEDGTLDASGRAHHAGIVPGQCGVQYECDIDDEIAELQREIRNELDKVIAKERQEAQGRRDTIAQENIGIQGVIYTGAALEGAKDATVGLVKFVGKAVWGAGKMIASMPAKLNPLTMPRRFKESVAELKETYQELKEFADEDLEVYWALASDGATWRMLTTFAKDYASAQHPTEWAESGGSAVPTIILALVTGGASTGASVAAGAGGTAASGASRLAQLGANVSPKLQRLVTLLKRRRAKQTGNGSENTTIETKKPVVGAAAVSRLKITKVECFKKKQTKHDPIEYDRQLAGQQDALNKMNAEDYIRARMHFGCKDVCNKGKAIPGCKKAKRNTAEAAIERSIHEDNLFTQYKNQLEADGWADLDKTEKEARKKAKEEMKKLAVLHNPDMIAGGLDPKLDVGDAGINSSIGPQWKTTANHDRVGQVDRSACAAKKQGKGKHKMNVHLHRC